MGNHIVYTLKIKRQALNMTIAEVVEQLREYDINITAHTLYKWEYGRRYPNAFEFAALCRIYGIDFPFSVDDCDESMDLKSKLKSYRKRRGLLQQDVADALGVAKSTYCAYEAGTRFLTPDRILQLASILNAPPEGLLNARQTVSQCDCSDGKQSHVWRVRMECKKRGVPITTLERDLKLAKGYLGKFRNGTIPREVLSDIAEYLHIPLDTLLYPVAEQDTASVDERETIALLRQRPDLQRLIDVARHATGPQIEEAIKLISDQ